MLRLLLLTAVAREIIQPAEILENIGLELMTLEQVET